MTQDQAYRIKAWIDEGIALAAPGSEYFEKGLALLGEVMLNTFYLGNIRRKGPASGMSILKYELQKRFASCGIRVESEGLKNLRTEGLNDRGIEGLKEDNVASCDMRVAREKPETRNTELETRNKFILRKEFPFLTDDDCPEEFKVLVADMITSHERYIKAHDQLYAVANKSNAECFAVGRVLVENYLNNRKCWEELEYYKKTRQILGEHALFAKRNREEEIKKLPVTELMKLYRTLPRNIRYFAKLMEDDKDSELNCQRLERKQWFEWELTLVRRLMDIKERKANSKAKAKVKAQKSEKKSSKLKK